MYTNDLKQVVDYLGINECQLVETPINEHDALCDARWNLKLYNIIKTKYGIQI